MVVLIIGLGLIGGSLAIDIREKRIAERIIGIDRNVKNAEDAFSIEPDNTSGFPKETHGLNKIIEKGNMFESMVEEFHECLVSEPLVTESSIAFVLTMDLTMKGQGRSKMEEICVYQVKDGKITSEHFFY